VRRLPPPAPQVRFLHACATARQRVRVLRGVSHVAHVPPEDGVTHIRYAPRCHWQRSPQQRHRVLPPGAPARLADRASFERSVTRRAAVATARLTAAKSARVAAYCLRVCCYAPVMAARHFRYAVAASRHAAACMSYVTCVASRYGHAAQLAGTGAASRRLMMTSIKFVRRVVISRHGASHLMSRVSDDESLYYRLIDKDTPSITI